MEYSVQLPPRSLKEFSFWVSKHLEHAQFLAPPDLVAWHQQAAQRLVARYNATPSPSCVIQSPESKTLR